MKIEPETDVALIKDIASQFQLEAKIYPFAVVSTDSAQSDDKSALLGAIGNEDLVLRLFYTLNSFTDAEQQLLLTNIFFSPRTIVKEKDTYYGIINVDQLRKFKEQVWEMDEEFKETTHLFNAVFHTVHTIETEVALDMYRDCRLDPHQILNSDIFTRIAMRTQYLYHVRVGEDYAGFVTKYFNYKFDSHYSYLGEAFDRKKHLLNAILRCVRKQELVSVH